MTIATVCPDGAPQTPVVSFVNDAADLFRPWRRFQKAKNIAHDRCISATVTAPYETWLELQEFSIAGQASEVTTSGEDATVVRAW